ncbi:growth hormone-regulated TBC protein 1-A [Microplitis mediator]|uniref:growth hormone-regulated TBC protein 1-A n=1 Tax=Microplitis demolitor TaxID=69319 RepID=UPI0004CCA34E|nr:growth hormone-regulated TBC protein 1-A [Microplitis demolitor]XP_057325953.1 growth hormone-regulated TBC protein 1-A [Microplitis mediator]
MATSCFSNVDEYGFERPQDFDYGTYEEFMSEYLKVLAKRAKKWADIVGDGKSVERSITIKRYVRKGIPGEYRGMVWLAVSGGEDLKNANPDLYQRLLNGPHNVQVTEIIKTDLPRTFPDNIFFNNTVNHQHQLYNILLAFAHQNETVGYCQGLNYIAGLLLLVTKSEETAFWLLKVLIEKILPDYYTPTMDGLLTDIDVLAEFVKLKIPEVYEHVTNLGLPWAVITTKWFICLFAEVLPIETTLRIWDCLFYEGNKIIFRVALTLIKRNKNNLLACDDFALLADCFKNITKDSIVLQCHNFMQSIFKVPGSLPSNTIAKLRTKVSQERAMNKKSSKR